jgi:hypothetical protein
MPVIHRHRDERVAQLELELERLRGIMISFPTGPVQSRYGMRAAAATPCKAVCDKLRVPSAVCVPNALRLTRSDDWPPP